ncbi:dTDP-4-dehydrorhamnose 3,5-epimerase [Hydrogenophaga taeniospiralis]|uniref:dTDP-4-dehydrorhamnose 3,5-epimerase n=1 Tax=Hydrogenophaga taeniospiralis TaxID=65656 RepID=UPI001CFB0107|nr:dTDP-4-dehydrorhamnose 3,5-epimerase [Hydrogenophaga taeniospiralis]MCB4364491.1 dTDP-4-dehydrorhamnose 3,5-epimerase [Hydrogenophaga taeniospiralis]
MIFTETKLSGAYIIDLEKRGDSRGFFARSFCQDEFERHGLVNKVVQTNVSLSKHQGTLRGMHYQESPYAETKLVRCTQGAIYDVIVDIRPESPTFKQWIGVELSSSNHRMLFVPQHFAHGFITLVDDSEVTYQVSQVYHPGSERGIRYNDPALGIVWPQEVKVISDKDASWPDMKQ